MANSRSVYRILSLDGGGSWALLQVLALREIYGSEKRGRDVLADFDLVAANSGGSLTLGGLLTDKTLDEILAFYLDEHKRRMVFSELPFELDDGRKPLRTIWNRFMQRVASVGAKYRTEAKLDGLRKLLEPVSDRTLGDLHAEISKSHGRSPHFVIVGFDYDRKRAKFFRSNAASLAGSGGQSWLGATFLDDMKGKSKPREATLAEAVHASSNAPVTFFMTPAVIDNDRYWDGAIGGYNNPVLAAVTEAIANRSRGAMDAIHVLSLGTGTVSLPQKDSGRASDPRLHASERQEPTLFGDLKQLAMSILDDPPDSATFTAHVLLGQPLPDLTAMPPVPPPVAGTVVRMSPVIRPVRSSPRDTWVLPPGLDIDDFLAIQKLELDAIGKDDVRRLVTAGKLWIEGKLKNQAIRENRHYECQIGHDTFASAVSAWRTLSADTPLTQPPART